MPVPNWDGRAKQGQKDQSCCPSVMSSLRQKWRSEAAPRETFRAWWDLRAATVKGDPQLLDFLGHNAPPKLSLERQHLVQTRAREGWLWKTSHKTQRHSRVLLQGHMDKKMLRKALGGQGSHSWVTLPLTDMVAQSQATTPGECQTIPV